MASHSQASVVHRAELESAFQAVKTQLPQYSDLLDALLSAIDQSAEKSPRPVPPVPLIPSRAPPLPPVPPTPGQNSGQPTDGAPSLPPRLAPLGSTPSLPQAPIGDTSASKVPDAPPLEQKLQ